MISRVFSALFFSDFGLLINNRIETHFIEICAGGPLGCPRCFYCDYDGKC